MYHGIHKKVVFSVLLTVTKWVVVEVIPMLRRMPKSTFPHPYILGIKGLYEVSFLEPSEARVVSKNL